MKIHKPACCKTSLHICAKPSRSMTAKYHYTLNIYHYVTHQKSLAEIRPVTVFPCDIPSRNLPSTVMEIFVVQGLFGW